ncbi:MAG: di-trans,poly-cis-decaprenylcistransferase [Candidatus Eremiobacteraeota bacterium]|nr:di-trans,poly-cis-decaprenylcistransferase [Candidatus Eremiobacteraeota bacterium]
MDGNRRWATARRLPAIEGHRRGIIALRHVTRAASDLGIAMLTVYGFSTENWKRDKTEISLLLDLCVYFAQSEFAELDRNNVRVRIIGQYQALPRASREALDGLVAKTAHNDGLQLNLAVNYSARAELRIALTNVARDVSSGALAPEAIDETAVASYLSTASMPDPDLLIRPGGESRLSNFLLYQLAEAELYLTDTLWPEFGRADFVRAIEAYRLRAVTSGGA